MNRLHTILRAIYNRWLRHDPLKDLQAQGLTVGNNFRMMDSVAIDWSHCWHITIGDDVTMAPGVRILAHDASTYTTLGYTRIGKVRIGDRTFIGACSIVLPGVTIGDDVVVGAGSVVCRDLPDGVVAVGNPAVIACTTDEWLARRREEMARVPKFSSEFTVRGGVSKSMKNEMNDLMSDGIGYVV